MWPSFSLWAWRILKIRSCLRMPLAPGRSRVRAILVNSVMFFSLSSAMVIRHLRGDRDFVIQGGYFQGDSVNPGQEGGAVFTQPAVVPQQNVPAQTKPSAAQSLQSYPELRSWFPGFGY